ncbi:MAG: dockerin type I domain-containing protein [Acidobacteriota bacterium]
MAFGAVLLRFCVIALAVTGISAQSLSATLQWDASASSDVTGYNLYRRAGSDTGYQKLTPSPISTRSFVDSVSYGQIYHYVATSVSSTGSESVYSGEATLDLICRGDVNVDGQRNVIDVVQIQNHIVGNVPLQGSALTAADVNGDGQVSVLDAVQLLNYVVGNLTLPTCIGG